MKKQRIASVFKDIPKITYTVAKNLNDECTVLIPDGYDGWNALPFVVNGHKVMLYEPEKTFIEGGEIRVNDEYIMKIKGLEKRINAYKLHNKITYFNSNFYEETVKQKYDTVYAYYSLHREENKNYSIQKKIKKLQQAVQENGILYICYLLAIDEDDFYKYPRNQYAREEQILSYFDLNEWEVISTMERSVLRKGEMLELNDEYKKLGYLYIRRRTKESTKIEYNLDYEYRFNIRIGQ